MADENLKDFTVSWILLGLLFFCLLSFAIDFMYNNNPEGFGDSKHFFDDTSSVLGSKLVGLPNGSNSLLNITSETNPEASFLGSRDSTAISYGLTGTSKGFFESSKIFFGWIFTGTTGELLLSVFGGLFSIVALYYVIKWIRQGF